jgi:ribosome-binding protein aMBF1 (putative translation factor)
VSTAPVVPTVTIGPLVGDSEHCELCGSDELLSYARDPEGRELLVCDSCKAKVEAVERWTIVTDEGLAMFREDLMTETEAREHADRHPLTPSGKPQVAVPESVAREAGRRWRTIERTHELNKRAERRVALLSLLDEAGVAPTFAARLSASARRAAREAHNV